MQTQQFQFAHHRLEVYRLALDQVEAVHAVGRGILRGYKNTADQMLRAAGSTVGLIGEGANRFSKGQKRQRFTEARGEAGEVAVHVEAGYRMRIVDVPQTTYDDMIAAPLKGRYLHAAVRNAFPYQRTVRATDSRTASHSLS